MMKNIFRHLLAAACLFSTAALPQAFPSKPVRMIITFPPGGPTDIAARLIAAKTGEGLGQPVLPDNRAGASGVIAAEVAARAAPDGYTILLSPVSSHLIPFFIAKKHPFHPVNDFTLICNATESSSGVVVNSSLPVHNLKDLIDLAKREPGKLTYSSAGVGTLFHLTGEIFNQTAGVNMVHIPYKGAAQALTDLSSGQISVTFSILAPVLAHVRSGKVRLIAILEQQRNTALPDVPSVTETLPGFQKLGGGLGFYGPAGLPRPIVQRLNAEISKAIFAPDVRAKLEEFGFRVTASTPEEFVALMKTEFETYGRAVKLAGLKPE
jgi:tripartite-type tricarboxylate transporter receptor subunit TctC